MESIDQIKYELTKRGMTQRQLAQILGISYKLLSGVINRSITSLRVEILLIEWLRDSPYDSRTSII